MDARIKEKLGEDLFKQVEEKLGDIKLLVNDGNYIPKSRFDEVNDANKSMKEQLDQTKQQLADVQKNLGYKEKDAAKLAEVQKKLEEKEKEVSLLSVKTAVKEALTDPSVNAKYPDLVIKEMGDLEKIEIVDGKIKGFDDIIKPIKEKYPDMFGTKKLGGDPPKGGKDPNPEDKPLSTEDWVKSVFEKK